MRRFQSKSISIILLILVLALAGCTRNRPGGEGADVPAPDQGGQDSSENIQPPAADGRPTTIAIQPTATPTLITDNADASGGDSPAPTNTPIAAPNADAPTPLPTATPAQSVPGTQPGGGTGQTIIHIVQPGENLFRIGLSYQIDANTLARFNGITNPNKIYVGQSIKIPTSGSGSGQTYIVQLGDSLTTIALKFGTTQNALLSINNLANPDLIYVGQKLRIP